MSSQNQIDVGDLINDRYLLQAGIGSGNFGKIYSALDKDNNDQLVAIKVANNQKASQDSSFDFEVELDPPKLPEKWKMNRLLRTEYHVLKHMENVPGFAKVIEFGRFGEESYLAMELLGKTVDQVFEECDKQFSLKTILLLTDQLLDRLRSLHGKGIIHGDLSPGNIMLGTGENPGLVHLIDFGFSSMYMDLETGEHLPDRENVLISGTAVFMSRHIHQRRQKSRRDDMESLAYIIAYFVNKGDLPWTDTEFVKDSSDDGTDEKVGEKGWKAKDISVKKDNVKGIELFRAVPREFAIFFERVRELKYDQWPNYVEYQNLFRRLGTILGVHYEDMSRLSLN